MNLRYIFLIALLTVACNQSPKLELTVTVPAITDGVVLLKQTNEIALNQHFKNGELSVKRQLQAPGFYSLSIIDNNKPITSKTEFDVYLENVAYTITPKVGSSVAYPEIITTSVIQRELKDYYTLSDKTAGTLDLQIDSLTRFLKSSAAAALPKTRRAALYASTRAIQKQRRDMDLEILQAYMAKHPDSKVGAHLMNRQYLSENPIAYNKVFQKFKANVKASDDGLQISNKLAPLLGVMTNAKAPEITGNTTDGKAFSKKSIKKKVILVEFWKPTNSASRQMHQRLVQGVIITPKDNANLAIVSVAIDDNRAAWLTAIKDEHKAWLDVSDLKGDGSPNVNGWGIKALPAYFLLDKNWHIIKPNIDFVEIDTEVHEYLSKH